MRAVRPAKFSLSSRPCRVGACARIRRIGPQTDEPWHRPGPLSATAGNWLTSLIVGWLLVTPCNLLIASIKSDAKWWNFAVVRSRGRLLKVFSELVLPPACDCPLSQQTALSTCQDLTGAPAPSPQVSVVSLESDLALNPTTKHATTVVWSAAAAKYWSAPMHVRISIAALRCVRCRPIMSLGFKLCVRLEVSVQEPGFAHIWRHRNLTVAKNDCLDKATHSSLLGLSAGFARPAHNVIEYYRYVATVTCAARA